MALKNLLVIVDHSKHTSTRVDYAASLADRFDAHLTGMYTKAPSVVPAFVMAQIPPEARKIHDDSLEQMAAQAHRLFAQRAHIPAVAPAHGHGDSVLGDGDAVLSGMAENGMTFLIEQFDG